MTARLMLIHLVPSYLPRSLFSSSALSVTLSPSLNIVVYLYKHRRNLAVHVYQSIRGQRAHHHLKESIGDSRLKWIRLASRNDLLMAWRSYRVSFPIDWWYKHRRNGMLCHRFVIFVIIRLTVSVRKSKRLADVVLEASAALTAKVVSVGAV